MTFEENNNNCQKLAFEPTKREDIALEELEDMIRKQQEKKVVSGQNTQQIKNFTNKKEPDSYIVDISQDRASKLGKFGWHETEGTFIPYLTRSPDVHLISKRMAEVKVLKGLQQFFSFDLLSCMYIDLIPATAAEADLLNDINKNHSDNCYGEDSFKQGDFLIPLPDLTEMITFLRYCCFIFTRKLVVQKKPCGFMKINQETVPYVIVDRKTYLPLFYFDGDTEQLEKNVLLINGWKAAYIRLLCKVQGVRSEFFEFPSIKCVRMDYLKKFFKRGTSFKETWPSENKLNFRAPPPSDDADTAQDKDMPPRSPSQIVPSSNQLPHIPSPVNPPQISNSSINPLHISHSSQDAHLNIPKMPHPHITPTVKAPQKPYGISKLSTPRSSPHSTLSQSQPQQALSNNTPQISSHNTIARLNQPQPYLPPPVYASSGSSHNMPTMSQIRRSSPNSILQATLNSPTAHSTSVTRPSSYQYLHMQSEQHQTSNLTSNPNSIPNNYNNVPPACVYNNGRNTMNYYNGGVLSRPPVTTTPFYEIPPNPTSTSSNTTFEHQPSIDKYHLQRAVLTNDAALIECIRNRQIEASGVMLPVDNVAKIYFNRPPQYVMMALRDLKVQVYKPNNFQSEVMKYRGFRETCAMITLTDLRRNVIKLQELMK